MEPLALEPLVIEPLYDGNRVPVVFGCDKNYALFTGVTIRNIIELAAPNRNYDIVILELGLEESLRREIAGLAGGLDNVSVRFFNIEREIAADNLDSIRISRRFTKEVFFPLFIPPLFRKYDKVLSLDCDVLLKQDIADLYDLDLGGNLAGAVIDYECTMDALLNDFMAMPNRAYIVNRLGVDPMHYCNSGVVSFNIGQLAEEKKLNSFIEALPQVFQLPDQDILNYVCKGRMKFIDMTWNVQAFAYTRKNLGRMPDDALAVFLKARDTARLIHYTYAVKPWFHPGCTNWWEIAARTPFLDRIKNGFLLNPQINPLKKKESAASLPRKTMKTRPADNGGENKNSASRGPDERAKPESTPPTESEFQADSLEKITEKTAPARPEDCQTLLEVPPSEAPLLSLVVPYYDKRATLPALLDSIQRQSLRDLEVVIVDDCSPDPCKDIATAYAGRGMRIRLFRHPANQGAKNARLDGVQKARGHIIAFADADDTLHGETVLEKHADLLLAEKADILQFNTILHDPANGGESTPEESMPLAPALEGREIFSRYVQMWGRGGTMWNKLYTRELCRTDIETCRASRVRWACEDYYLTAWFMFHARRYRSSADVGYRYNDNFERTRGGQAAGRIVDICHVLREFVPYLKSHGCPPGDLKQFVDMSKVMLENNLNWQNELLYGERTHDSSSPGGQSAKLHTLLGRVPAEDFALALHYALSIFHQDMRKAHDLSLRLQKKLEHNSIWAATLE